MAKMLNRSVQGALALAMMMTAGAAAAQDAPPALLPGLSGPLSYNPKPMTVDVAGTKLYVTAIGSGYLGTQSNTTRGVASSFADVSNAQVIVQKPEGVLQFLVQAGLYSHETLGLPYARATSYTDATYGPVPQAWVKIAPSSSFSIQGGILPTLIGLEAPFSFQNMNIERGVLWGQENVLTRGVQANVASGKFSASVALTDGFFSGKFNWLSGIVSYVDGPHTLSLVLGGALSKNYRSTFSTPTVQNNSTILNVIYSYAGEKLLVQPYFQYAWVPNLPGIETTKAENWAVGLLAKYKIDDNWSLPVRFEYIDSKARAGSAANFLYGPGSNAFSVTVTPTYTWDRFFIRPEVSFVQASGIVPGAAFGSNGLEKSQVRGRLEFGVMF
ncbi:outer membrane beta-barrel protein [Sandarakinorhabdus oryzae]|uniref:outer membrane beta-barrel protein n=1 Tax=Sandarakinorhabdus oryzae TaxID=2675220 RepID=UPI0018CBF5BC|nr:outer membrane beta-barrel protein [Sandarakinorhabdus oryzae]